MRDHTKLTLEQIQRWVLMRMEWAKARGVNRLDDEHKRKAEEILSEIDDTDGDADGDGGDVYASCRAGWIADMQRVIIQMEKVQKECDEARHQRDVAEEERDEARRQRDAAEEDLQKERYRVLERAGVQVDAMRKERDEARHQRDEAREELRLFKIQSVFQAKVATCDTCEYAGIPATAFPCSVCPQGAGTLEDFLRWEPQR